MYYLYVNIVFPFYSTVLRGMVKYTHTKYFICFQISKILKIIVNQNDFLTIFVEVEL